MKYLAGILVSLFCLSVNAEMMEKKIHRGNWNLGGSASVGYDSLNGTDTSVNPYARYFVADKVALGGIIGFTNNDRRKFHAVGLSGAWYFYEGDTSALFFAQSFTFQKSEYKNIAGEVDDFRGSTGVGYEYFFTASVSFGPILTYSYFVGEDESRQVFSESRDRTELLFNFNIFL